jgi:acyl-CoA reductase-like NAD-dependent aldehyde dehydrogenase
MTTLNRLNHAPSNLVGGVWAPLPAGGLESRNPAHPSRVVWAGSSRVSDGDAAVRAARAALPVWSAWTLDRRVAVLRRFGEIAKARKDALADLICEETGKAMWESAAEAGLIAGKVDITRSSSRWAGPRRRGATSDRTASWRWWGRTTSPRTFPTATLCRR